MTKSKSDHVVMGQDSFRCLHCGDEYNLAMPCSIGILTAASKAYIKDHKGCKKNPLVGERRFTYANADEWYRGWDTGISSKTIWSVMTGKGVNRYDVPYDPADFGRCYRLLQRFPEWVPRLYEVMVRFPEWEPFVKGWSELTTIYEEELNTADQRAHKLFEMMQAMVKEAQKIREGVAKEVPF